MSKKTDETAPLEQEPKIKAAQEQPDEVPAQEASVPAEELEQMAKRADSLEKELLACKDQHLRLAAEYDNFRKRSQKEKETIYQEAQAATVLKLLPVYDNLERALLQPTEDEAFRKGIELTMNQCREIFEKLGVAEIPALNAPFDPDRHNAVMHVEDPSVGENTVVEVLQKGFTLGERVIRVAMVKVAN